MSPPDRRARRRRPACHSRTPLLKPVGVATTTSAHQRNRLAQSVLSHATPQTATLAIDRALLALQGATIDDLLDLAAGVAS